MGDYRLGAALALVLLGVALLIAGVYLVAGLGVCLILLGVAATVAGLLVDFPGGGDK